MIPYWSTHPYREEWEQGVGSDELMGNCYQEKLLTLFSCHFSCFVLHFQSHHQILVPGRREPLRGGAVPDLQHADLDGGDESWRWELNKTSFSPLELRLVGSTQQLGNHLQLAVCLSLLSLSNTNNVSLPCCVDSPSSGLRERHLLVHQLAGLSLCLWRSAVLPSFHLPDCMPV